MKNITKCEKKKEKEKNKMSKKLFVCPNCNLGFKAEWQLTSYIVCPSCKIKILTDNKGIIRFTSRR